MAASYPPTGRGDDGDTDLGAMWQEAMIKYYEECGTDLRSIPMSRLNYAHIQAESDRQLLLFSEYRHDKGKLDKLRSVVAQNADIVTGVASCIANAATAAFPPSAVILTAFNYVMSASKAVSDDYDMIISFFDIMNSFLMRVSMLQGRMPDEAPFRRFLVNVFSSMLTLSAIARRCRLKGRLSKWAKALVDGSDPKLKGAFDALHMHLERFESTVMIATLKYTIEMGKKTDVISQDIKGIQSGVKDIQSGVEKNLVLSQQGYILGLETKGYSKDAAATSHDILNVVSREAERGAEHSASLQQVMNTLNKLAKKKGPGQQAEQLVDSGSRKSTAMRTLAGLLGDNLDDSKAQMDELEGSYVGGTYQWFQDNECYSALEAGVAPLVWVTGSPGMGKSTLAYTVVRALHSEFIGHPTTSVARFFFREDIDNMSDARIMLRSCAWQVAVQNLGYREEVLAEMQLEINRTSNRDLFKDDRDELWGRLFRTKFAKVSGRRLVLVLDGVDEADEDSREFMESILREVGSADGLNIQVLFTGDKAAFDFDGESAKVLCFEMTKEHILPDMRAILMARMKSLSRLRKLSSRARNKILTRLSKEADTIRYIDHMLRRLNQIGREKPVLRELEKLPSSTEELYKILLEDCQKARTDEDILVLRKFFAWMAYSKEPLTLVSANLLLSYLTSEEAISIDEELDHRCARILRLSNTTADDDRGSVDGDSDSESDKLDDDKTGEEDKYFDEDLYVHIGFQERALRGYFRPSSKDTGDRLRSPASEAHVMIFEAIGAILTSTTKVDSFEFQLRNYAVTHWAEHLQSIDIDDLDDDHAARVIESIYSILSNRNGSIHDLESIIRAPWDARWTDCVLGGSDEEREKMLGCLQKWAVKAMKLPSSALSVATAGWMRPFVRNPKAIYIKLADAHVTNWLTSSGGNYNYHLYISFCFAYHALFLGRELPAVRQNDALRDCFGHMLSVDRPSVESFMTVSQAFLHIDMTAKSYMAISGAMMHRDFQKHALDQLNLALSNSDTDIDLIEIYQKKGDILAGFLERAMNPRMTRYDEGGDIIHFDEPDLDAELNLETERGLEKEPDGVKDTNAIETCDSGEQALDEDEEDEEAKHRRQKMELLARATNNSLAKAIELADNLDPSVLEESVGEIICEVWLKKAEVACHMGETTNLLEYCRKAKASLPKGEDLYPWTILNWLEEANEWAKLIELLRIALSTGNGFSSILNSYRKTIIQAAKKTGEIEYVDSLYRGAVLAEGIPGGAWSNMNNWALFYQDVVSTPEAMEKAKAILNEVIDTNTDAPKVTEAAFRLANILLEEFRRTKDPKQKVAAYEAMEGVVERMSDSMGNEFDPTQSQTMIPLAFMMRKMDAVKYQQTLERTFHGCVEALTDEMGWNDKSSCRMLAKVLATVGLDKDAQIALTCQLYIIDMDIHAKENNTPETEDDEEKLGHGGSTAKSQSQGDDKPGDAEVKIEPPLGARNAMTLGKERSESVEGDGESERSSSASEGDSSDLVESEDDADLRHKFIGDQSWDQAAIRCNGCNGYTRTWYQALYLCYYCTEMDLCGNCMDKRTAAHGEGKDPEDFEELCPQGHKHIRGPVDGWKGLKNGMLRFEDKEIPFKHWLTEVKEKAWPEAWERFWAESE